MIDDLKLAISEKDLDKARRILKTELFQREYPPELLKDTIDLVSSYDVFEIHDGEKFLPNPKEWTMEYLEKLKADLDDNFSKERFMRAYYVARTIEKLKDSNNGNPSISIYKQYKNFSQPVKIGAVAATGVLVVGIGLLIYKINKK
jgi:hypothetical protein